jgi:uncharacterized protein
MKPIAALAVAAVLSVLNSAAAAEPALTALPGPLETRNPPVVWTAKSADALAISAGPKTNWFVPPWNAKNVDDNAPTLLFRPEGDFSLSAKVSLQPKSRWDSGALTVFIDKDNWAKLCLENAKGDGKLSVVMVVNRGVSDDSYTDFVAPENALYLKVTRKGTAFFFNASRDGKTWTMFRAFALGGDAAALRAGLLAQSPVGDGMTVEFSEIRYEAKP